MDEPKAFRAHLGGWRWNGVELHAYKDDSDAPYKDITRQTLFRRTDMAGELRYFEIEPGGFSTLERHRHGHAVMVIRGEGRCLAGSEVRDIAAFDLISIAPMEWHQFRAGPDSPLGFLCMVDQERDRPQLPSEDDLAVLGSDPRIAAFFSGIR